MGRGHKFSFLETKSISKEARFHGYILVAVIGIRWNVNSIMSAIMNETLYNITKEYLTSACGDDEWLKGQVLESIRDQKASYLRVMLKSVFPSMFQKGRLKALQIPDEIKDKNVRFDIDLINRLREQVASIKKEMEVMNDETLTPTTPEEAVEVETPVVVTPKAVPTVQPDDDTVNFIVPTGKNSDDITVDNYKELTGKRFRMTRAQKARGLTREQAFDESKARAFGSGENHE